MSTKRILSLVLALVMVLGTFGTVFADTAETPTEETPEVTATVLSPKVQWLVDQGIVTGNESGDLMLDKTIDRASVAKMIVEALEQKTSAAGLQGVKSPFKDVPVTHWSNGNINAVNGLKLMIGSNGNFMPSSEISYNEVITIIVRMVKGLTAEEEKVAVWPATYVAKASQLGLLEGLTATNYAAPAIREDILGLFYNVLTSKEVGSNTIIKAIVLENNRVEALNAANKIVVEVIKEVQRANYADASRFEKGDQESYVVTSKIGDVEEMLGKVYDFTLDKNGNIINAKLDTTYQYIATYLHTITKNKVNGYTVELDERYKERDERIFRTYHNDKSYAYQDFEKDFESVDYARVTVKNGKVLFIDAYTFEDVAPIKEVKRDGVDVYVYNDYRDAREEKVEPRALVIGVKDGKFSRIDRKDIKANDVIHVYARNKVIVRQDAVVEGEYLKVERDSYGDYYAHIGSNSYYIGDADYFRPVYAHDSKAYTTLYAREASSVLREFYKENVTALVDIDDSLQLFGADIQYTEGMALVRQILARGQGKFLPRDNNELILDEDYSSSISTHNLGTGKTTTNQRLNSFNTRDLVFVKGSDNLIATLVRIATEDDMITQAKALKTTTSADMNNSFIRLANNDRYQVLDRTNVFVIKDGAVSATTVAKLQASLAADSALNVFILSDSDVTKLVTDKVITDRNKITNEKDVAHTLVFIEPTYAGSSTNSEIILVDSVYTGQKTHDVDGTRSDRPGDKENVTRLAAAGVSLVNMLPNDIVRLNLTKDDAKLIASFAAKDVLIAGNKVSTDAYRVIGGEFNYSRYEQRRLILEDKSGEQRTFWLTKANEEFGTVTVDSVVTFHLDGNGDIDVIRVYKSTQKVTGSFEIIDKKDLEAAIANAEAIVEAEYTKESVDALKLALTEVKVVLADKDATQAQVDAAVAKLEVAIKALAKKPVEPVEPVEPTITATAETKTLLGATHIVITVTGATGADVEKVLINGVEATVSKVEGNSLTLMSAVAVNTIKIVVAGVEYNVVID